MFLEEIKPYRKQLNAFSNDNSIPSDRKKLKKILDLFDKHLKFIEYPGSQATLIGCGQCVVNAFNRLNGKIARDEASPKRKTVVKETIDSTLTAEEVIEVATGIGKNAKISLLQQECKDKGLKFHHKAGIKKLQEILKG